MLGTYDTAQVGNKQTRSDRTPAGGDRPLEPFALAKKLFFLD